LLKAPRNALPIGVRAAATITASFIVFSLINRMLINVV
jgi:hypothetical protein